MLRRCTVATCAAACQRPAYFSRTPRLATTSFKVRQAPRTAPEPLLVFFRASIRRSDTSVAGVWWRRFMLGRRSVPPAIGIARGPSAARICAAFPGRRHEHGLWVRHVRKAVGSDSRRVALGLFFEGGEHLVRRDRQLVD